MCNCRDRNKNNCVRIYGYGLLHGLTTRKNIQGKIYDALNTLNVH